MRAARLTRDAVFDALAKKHTYGTTGQRIYIDLDIAGVKMGQSGRAPGLVDGRLTIAAPSDIVRVELVRYDLQAGKYIVARHWDDAGRLLETSFRDEPDERRVMYYVRVQLRDPVRGRPARGWSSPVWLDRIAER